MRRKQLQAGLLLSLMLSTIVLWPIESAHAAAVTGRFGLWSYLRDDSVDHVQVVPLLSLNVHRFGGGAWNFESTWRGFADFQNGDDNGTAAVRVSRALLIWKPDASPWEVRAGQQWLNEGIGRGNLLGLWSSYAFSRKTDLRVYGGARPQTSLSLDERNPEGGFTAGMNLRARFGPRQLGFSYSYVSKDGDVLYSGAGIDFHCRRVENVTLRARLHMNLEQSSIETAQFAAYWDATKRLQISLDARSQTPRVFEDSFFAMFLEEAKTTSARGGAQYTLYRRIYATGMGYVVMKEGDMLYKTRLGLGDEYGEVGYTHWLSAGEGDMDGFYGFSRRSFANFEAHAGFDYSRGSNSEVRPNTEAQVIYGGLSWSPQRMFSLGCRVEHLKNQYHSEDWRALLSLSTSFRTKLGGEQ